MNFPLTEKLSQTTTDEGLKKELQQLLRFAQNGAAKIAEIIGKVFIKTATIIKGVVPAKGATIQSLLTDFEKAANEKGITDVYIDPDITGWFPKEKVSQNAAPDSRLIRFVNSITHASIIDGAKQLNAYQEHDLSDAIQRATQLVTAGELDKKDNTGIIIYLTNRKDGTPCRLGVWRFDVGRLSLHVNGVNLVSERSAGDGALVSNENLGG